MYRQRHLLNLLFSLSSTSSQNVNSTTTVDVVVQLICYRVHCQIKKYIFVCLKVGTYLKINSYLDIHIPVNVLNQMSIEIIHRAFELSWYFFKQIESQYNCSKKYWGRILNFRRVNGRFFNLANKKIITLFLVKLMKGPIFNHSYSTFILRYLFDIA